MNNDETHMRMRRMLNHFTPQLVIESLSLLGKMTGPIHKSHNERGVLTNIILWVEKLKHEPPEHLLYIDELTAYECRLFQHATNVTMGPEFVPVVDTTTIFYDVVEVSDLSAFSKGEDDEESEDE